MRVPVGSLVAACAAFATAAGQLLVSAGRIRYEGWPFVKWTPKALQYLYVGLLCIVGVAALLAR